MTFTMILPLLVTIVGCLVYALSGGKASEVGRAALWCGLLVTLLVFSNHGVKF
jgi:hypothetical protein